MATEDPAQPGAAAAGAGPPYAPPGALAGPFGAPRYTGVRTFGRCPLVADAEGVDVAVVGIPFAATTMRPGARFGPEAIRSASTMLVPYNGAFELLTLDVLPDTS